AVPHGEPAPAGDARLPAVHDVRQGPPAVEPVVGHPHLHRHPGRLRHLPAREPVRDLPQGDPRGRRDRRSLALAHAAQGRRPRLAADPERPDGLLLHLDLERVPAAAVLPQPAGLAHGAPRPRAALGRAADRRDDFDLGDLAERHPHDRLLPHLPTDPHPRHHGRSSQVKFTDGFWALRPGVTAHYAQEAYDVEVDGDEIVVVASTRPIRSRGHVLNLPVLTVTLSSPAEGVIKVSVAHHTGGRPRRGFELDAPGAGKVEATDEGAVLTTGDLRAVVRRGTPWDISFWHGDRRLTGSGHKSLGYLQLAADAAVTAEPAGLTGVTTTGLAGPGTYVHAQLDLGVGETVYGLGERFGPLVKNGQSVDIWNSDGGTSSDQAYKNVPFYLTNRGYGVFVDHPEHVSFEVGSEAVERVQFSVPGEVLEFFVIDGPEPNDVIDRYTRLTGRPPVVPAWSYGLWLSTSFTTDYDESTVTSFIDGMRERDIPLSVFHFDCFWMREFQW